MVWILPRFLHVLAEDLEAAGAGEVLAEEVAEVGLEGLDDQRGEDLLKDGVDV